jgi:hypothetical protein
MKKEWNNKPEKALLIYLIILAVLGLAFIIFFIIFPLKEFT